MNVCKRIFFCVAGSLWSLGALAASDPVSWSLSPVTGFPSTAVGQQSAVEYTLTNQLPLPTQMVTQTVIKGGNFSVTDKCNKVTLAPKASCNIGVSFTPASAQKSTFQLIYGYDNNRIKLPILTAMGTGQSSTLSGVIQGLPATLAKGVDGKFTAIYTNNGITTLTGCTIEPNFTTSGVPATLQSSQGVPPCTGSLLAKHSCHLNGSISSNVAGALTLTGHMTCTGPKVVKAQPSATTTIKNPGGCAVNAAVALPLPETTHTYSDNIVRFKLTNQCSAVVNLSTVTINVSGVAAVKTVSALPQLSNCSSTLAAGASCIVSASIIPQAVGSMTVKAQVVSNGSQTSSAATNASVVAPVYTHKINFINQCPFPVWYGVENIANNPNITDPTLNPTPAAYLLAGQNPGVRPAVKSITIPGNYSGEFFPRTGCKVVGNKLQCDTGDCNSPAATGTCNGDATSPFTRIEEVFFATNSGAGFQGTYDLSLINGISIPVEMKGLGPASSIQFGNPPNPAPFYCTGAGAPIQPAQLPPTQNLGTAPLGMCSWDFSVPSSFDQNMIPHLFNFVTDNSVNNDCSNSCSNGEVCGLAYTNNNAAQPVRMSCGKLIGYWTINQACSPNTNYAAGFTNPKTIYNCAANYSGTQQYPQPVTNYDIYSCNTKMISPGGPVAQLGSCYPSSSSNASLCCGAQDWNEVNSPNQLNYLTAQDTNYSTYNPDWTTSSPLLPSPYESILWIKQGCPTAYTYPYDDHSSSFRCFTSDIDQTHQVPMDFDVVFCPGGLTGQLSLAP